MESGTLSSTKGGITLIESEGNLTINGGKFYAPYEEGSSGTYAIHTIHQYNDNAKTMITGGEIDGVVLIQRDDSAATGTPNYGDIPVQIKGGTFKQHVLFRWTEKGKPSGDPTEFSPAVEIAGGIFEKRVNGLTGIWGEDLSTKLTGGTFKDFPNRFGLGRGGKSDHEYYSKSLGNSIIMRGNEIRTSCDWSEADWFKVYFDCFYLLSTGSESTPVTVIPNAWGIIDVTLNGDPIDYFKDWNGAAKEIDNSTAYTLKFEWYPLAQELKDAGYSYDAKCEHYVSGSTAVEETENIAANATSHTITIEKGADPKVYSFDLKLNLKKNGNLVGIVHNQHIVKLVVKPAEVPTPDPTIDGTVYYTSGIVYGSPISIAASVTPASATPAYQWQRSTDGGSTWENIDGATSGKYTPVAADMGENVRIRVVVTAEGYLGEIVGAPLTVNKAANDNTPAPPAVAAQKDDSGAYKKFVISDFNSDKQEYVYTDSPASGSGWPSGTPISSATVEELDTGRTYYIYTRFKETDTHTAGSKISSSSVLLDDVTKLNQIILTDKSSGKVYGSYGNGNTIYIQKDTSVTLTATTNPVDANKWSAFTFKSQYNASAPFSVTPTDSVASGAEIPSVTIHGNEVGTGTLAAEYGGYPAPQSYGTWRVHVYENVSDIGTGAEITVSPSFPDMTMYVGDTMPLPEGYTVDVYPEGALENYDLEWRIVKPGTHSPSYETSDDNITLENDEIKATKKHTGSENTRIALVAINKKDNNYISSLSDFYVTVTDAPTVELTGVIVAPTQVNLDIGKDIQLSAVRQPANAEGTLEWESSNTGVATVDKKTGEVTAVAKGEATITVTCKGKSADCIVLVDHTHDYTGQTWQPMGPGLHSMECVAHDYSKAEPHNFSAWTDNNDDKTHSHTCDDCKYTETAEHTWVWVVDQEAALNQPGLQHEECTGCHAKRNENTEIPALQDYAVTVTGGTATAAAGTPITRAMEGVEVTVTAKAPAGKHFVEWVVKAGGVTLANETSATTTFIMPANDVTIEANFEKNASTGTGTGATTYPITVKSAKNGDVTASHKSAAKGTTITLTVDPDKGYLLDTLTVLDGNDKELKLTEKNGKYTFTMPDSKVTVAATFKASAPTGKNPFIDVPAGAYYEDAVVWAVGKNITTGMSATTFDPNGSCTRAQIVTFLWRAAGSPEPKTMKGFDDVASNAYYAKAVAWAVENGITTGTSASKFSPNDPCTRTQAVTFLFRYAAANGMEAVTMQELLSGYADAASVPSYAVSAMNWALAAGILQGDGVKLMPNATCTRAQIVTFLYRAMK